jgi:hypothetical protein
VVKNALPTEKAPVSAIGAFVHIHRGILNGWQPLSEASL